MQDAKVYIFVREADGKQHFIDLVRSTLIPPNDPRLPDLIDALGSLLRPSTEPEHGKRFAAITGLLINEIRASLKSEPMPG